MFLAISLSLGCVGRAGDGLFASMTSMLASSLSAPCAGAGGALIGGKRADFGVLEGVPPRLCCERSRSMSNVFTAPIWAGASKSEPVGDVTELFDRTCEATDEP